MKNSTANSRAKVSLALAMALCVLGGGNSLLASESKGDLTTKAIDSKDLSANHNDSNDSTTNLRKDLADSTQNLSNDSIDSTQTINRNIILAQNDTNQNATNPSATDSNAESTDSTEPTLLDKVLGLGGTARGKSDTYDLGRIERTVGGDADENSTVVVVSSEDMEQEGAKDVAHALRFTPGVFYMPYSSGKSSVFIRGFGEEAMGFYFDGIPINDIYDGNAAGATDLTPFIVFGLNEIQVSKGYTSPMFSSGKMGGALNMVTSKPKDKLEIRAGYMFIANNEHRVNAQVGSNWGNQYFQLTYSYMQRKSLNYSYNYSGEGPVAIPNTAYKNNFLSGKYGFTPNGNHEYSLNFYFQNAKRVESSFPFYDKTAFYILGHSQFNKLVSLDSKLWYHMNANQSGTRTNWSSLYDDYSLGITESVKLDFSDDQNLKVGFTIKNDNHKAVDYPGSWAKRNWHILNSSIFTEYALRVNDIFRFVLSGSYDRQDGLRVTNNNAYNKKDKNQHIQGWTLQGIGYVTLGEYWTIHANVGHKTNFPKLRTLYGNGLRLAENKNLTDESLINAELGATFDWNSGQISATVFYNYIHNMIISTRVDSTLCEMPAGSNGNLYCYRYENAKNGWSVGAEASIRQGFWDDKLVLGANWTFIHRVTNQYNNNGNKTGSREFTTHPRQNINFNVLIAPIKYFDVNIMGSVQTSRWAYRSQYDDYVKLPTVFYFDLVANYYVTNAFKLTFGAYNLFDRNYNYNSNSVTSASAGGLPGRRVFAGFEYRF